MPLGADTVGCSVTVDICGSDRWVYYRETFDVNILHTLSASTLPADLTEIGAEAFRGTDVVFLRVPDGVVSIGSKAFADSGLKQLLLPNDRITVAEDAFEGCKGLRVFTLR